MPNDAFPAPHVPPGLTPRQQARLGAILARLNSPFAGEREAARRAADAFLTAYAPPPPAGSDLMLPAPRAQAPVAAPVRLQPGQDRRRTHRPYRGYERRRRPGAGLALNLSL